MFLTETRRWQRNLSKITKNTEPKAWTQYRLTPGAAFKPIPELVNSLLDEQG